MIKTERDKYLLIGLIGVLFAIIAWFFIASPIKTKTEELKTANIPLKETADLYVEINAQIDTYEKKIEDFATEKETILAAYPAAIAREDQIMSLVNLEDTFHEDLAISTLTLSAWETVMLPQEEAAPVATETTDEAATDEAADAATTDVPAVSAQDAIIQEANLEAANVILYRAPSNFTFVATYSGLKNMINYVYSQNDKMGIENLTVAFDSTTGNLAGNMDINQFFMSGTDKQYAPTKIPTVPKGISDVFHTVEGAGLTVETEEAEEVEETEESEESEE